MPPKPKFTKDEVVAAALDVVSKRGADGLTAKSLAEALGSSARPIFTVFNNMKEVQDEVRVAALARFDGFCADAFPDMPFFKQIGMKMVLFGLHEPKLYQLLFMRDNETVTTFDDLFGELGKHAQLCVDSICRDYALRVEDAKRLFENMWIYTFGLGTLCATKVCRFSEAELGQMLTAQFRSLMAYIANESR